MAAITYIEHDGAAHRIEVPDGHSVMEGAVNNGLAGIDAECGGNCACATCQVFIDDAWTGRIEAPSDMEEAMLDMADQAQPGARLSCQIKVGAALDGLIVRLPATQGKD
jgi:2Fe-2S ferredoxin